MLGENGPNYWERLKILKIYSLERRRERYMILYIFKVFHGLVPNPGYRIQENDRVGPKLYVPVKDKNCSVPNLIYERNMLNRSARLFNILPKEIRKNLKVKEVNMNMIKSMLDKLLKKIPDQPSSAKIQKLAISNSLLHQIDYTTE